MAGKDKHPPQDPKRHSTNKRVSAPSKTGKVGTAVKTSTMAKTVRPGSANTTSANTQKATVTKGMTYKAEDSKLRKKGLTSPFVNKMVKKYSKKDI